MAFINQSFELNDMQRKPLSELSYILEKQPSDEYLETSAFDDMKGLVENENSEEESEFQSFLHSALTYVNTIVGSGLIGIAYALNRAGFGFGLLLLVFIAFITDYSLILMVRCGHICGKLNYPSIMGAAYGKYGYYLLSALQFIYPFMTMVSYNVVVGDTLSQVLVRFVPHWSKTMESVRVGVVLITTIFIVIPMCLHRKWSKLAEESYTKLLCMLFILLCVVYKLMTKDYKDVIDTSDPWLMFNGDIIPALGVMAFAFMCHHNTFLVYQNLQNASLSTWQRITHWSVGFALIISSAFGVAGYLTFRGSSQGDLLENYCWDDDLMNLCRIVFSTAILLAFPIECIIAREIIQTQIHLYRCSDENCHYSTCPNQIQLTKSADNEAVITLGILVAAFIISPSTNCLGPILELNGLVAAIPLAYILPGLAFIQLETSSVWSKEKLPALGLVIFGGIVTIAGIINLLSNLQSSCTTGTSMGYCAKHHHG